MTQERAEKAVAQDASNGAALGYGAVSLAVLGDSRRAREWIDRALMIDPENNTMRYNLACSLATYLKDKDAAIELLGPYFERVSVSELSHCGADPDMDPLRSDPRFEQMASAARARLSGGSLGQQQVAQSTPIAAA
jgi:adenylate cyclase